MRVTLPFFVATCFLPLLPAQATLTVGPGGYAEISTAVAAALPGDLIVVSPGTYAPFTVTVGLTIVAPTGASVIGSSPTPNTWHYSNFGAPAGQTLVVVGLSFQSSTAVQPHVVRVQGGQVVFETCSFRGGHPAKVQHALACLNSDVVLRACLINPAHSGVLIDGGSLSATDTTVLPTDLGGWNYLGLVGTELRNARAAFAFCDLRGASALSNPSQLWSPHAMLLSGTSMASLADCAVTGGDVTTGPPVPAIVNNGSAPVRYFRSSIVGGFGDVRLSFGVWRQRGPSFVGPNTSTALLGAVGMTSGMRMGNTYGFGCSSEPNRLIIVVLGYELRAPQPHALALQPIRFDPLAVSTFALGVTDAQGLYQPPPIQIPSGILGRTAWLHPVMLDGNLFEVGPPIGGLIY